ncbi:MAG: ferrous iron transport protein B [Erysipelotrichaceae bacterium]|jgi:ferrous iron transport protein B|nr:ferrous iron transport protein B [Erysipelotrichaceae bacterium]MCI1326672.1 ferrous iron transport protein B [Solobacterium sp.]MCH4044706.1 ferrous iron transport protein B [Erysipelotrichaceae bacterium]MCH4121918.1 ferrous iron transport protein B [Erysipelotrichaceae bacterium]MCI1385273.1 ferrous iron transport protein B [Solobacterium sp.]
MAEEKIRIALAGNPNCGKTTLFNALTGSNQYVGNWPGVTVEKKEGRLKKHEDVIIQDLPGIYSLSPYTLEEVVSRNYLVKDKPDVILNIIDGTNLERNLYLTTQLAETGIPMVIAVNMMDLVRKNGDDIDFKGLSRKLGCRVIEISALHQEGIMDAAQLAIKAAREHALPLKMTYSSDVEQALHTIETKVLSNTDESQRRWYAVKVFERDEKVMAQLTLTDAEKKTAEETTKAVETSLDDDAESIITNEKYEYIASLLKGIYRKKHAGQMSVSDRIDQVVTNRWLALPIFAVIMTLTYLIAVSGIGQWMTDWVNDTLFGGIIQPGVQTLMQNAGCSDWLVSLVVDGIIGGLAAPIGFLPQMMCVFFFLSVLEDCGYMSRVAFIMDRIFRRFGLSGKSFIPFLISSGCGVPGIMATRTIENEKDRRMTMITTTSIPCGAKLPVIAMIAGYLMGGTWWFAPVMYFAGIGVVVIMCIIMKKSKMFAGDPAPFVMELPAYHIPSLKGVLMHVWERSWAFLKKAGTILFLCCAVMWFLASFGIQNGVFGLVDTEASFLAYIGRAIAWIFVPLGFGTWQAVASSISGFVAKEGIVSTMGVLAGLGDVEEYTVSMHQAFAAFFPTGIAAVSFLVFNCFDSPCLAAISTMAKEMNNKRWFWFAILVQNLNAYCISLMVYQLGGLMVGEVAFGAGTIAAVIVLCIYLYLLLRPDYEHRARTKTVAEEAA